MPYQFIPERELKPKEEPKITETKELEIPKPKTEEELQLQTVKEYQDKFFDEDDEIIEVNFD